MTMDEILGRLIKFLNDKDARITCGDRWLVCTLVDGKYIFNVYERKYNQKKTRELYDTDDLEIALYVLGAKE